MQVSVVQFRPWAPSLFQPIDPHVSLRPCPICQKSSARLFALALILAQYFSAFATIRSPDWIVARNIVGDKPNAFAANAEEGAHDLRFTADKRSFPYSAADMVRIEPRCRVAPRQPPIRHRVGTA